MHIQNFIQITSIHSQNYEQKQNLRINKGHNCCKFVKNDAYNPGLGKTKFLSVPDQNLEIGTDWKQPKAQNNRSHTGPILRKFSPILSDI